MRKSVNPDFKFLSNYVPKCELQALKENLKGEEGEYFKNLLCNLKEKMITTSFKHYSYSSRDGKR